MKISWEDHTQEAIDAKDIAVERALEAIGLAAEGYAKLLCPVDTGRLRNSITHDVRAEEDAVYVGTNVEYAAYVEFGTSRMKAQKYMEPAIKDHKDEYEAIARKAISGMW